MSVSLVDSPSHGSVTLSADGSYTYFPAADYAGFDQFTYRASDGLIDSNLATVNITVSVDTPDELLDYLRITELNYHPYPVTFQERSSGFTDRERFEFIELTNAGAEPLDLTGVKILGSIEFEFFDQIMLDPDEHAVLVKDIAAFEQRYGGELPLLGEYDGDMHNSRGQILLADPFDRPILNFTYNDSDASLHWADGFGSSLEVISATGGDYNSADNWRASSEYGGSPGLPGLGQVPTVVINEVLTHSNLPLTDAIELYNTTDLEIDVSGWYLSDSANDLKKFIIPDGTIIQPGGYAVFDEHDFNPERWNPGVGGFAFDSALGDDVWLMAADSDGVLTQFVDRVEFRASLNGESFSRWPNGVGELVQTRTVTLGSANGSPRIGPVVISEVMYNPPSPDGGVKSGDLEYIEIYNPTTDQLDLRNWQIRGGVDYNFPNTKDPELSLNPGETILIVSFSPGMPPFFVPEVMRVRFG